MSGEPATTPGERNETEVGSVFVSNYPPYSFWTPAQVPEAERVLNEPPRPGATLGLYLHVPFCRKRCKFCYFKVYTDKNSAEIERYLGALAREVELAAERRAIAGRPLEFVYFGGGTPSFIGVRQLQALVARVQAALPWTGTREVSFECEPGTLTEPKLEAIRGIGVTRLSLGVESFDDTILEQNGRAHVSKEIDRVIPWIRALDFPGWNLDLIAGMVGETWDTWRATVRRTIEAAPDSVTIYQMELPYNTVYSQGLLAGNGVPLADWSTKRAWHDWAFSELEAAGYEVSSAYTVLRKGSGARFVYRDAVWHGTDLLGAGVASFSHASGVHFQNEPSIERYITRIDEGALPIERAFRLSPGEAATRELILQLKLGRIDGAYFRSKFGLDVAAEFAPALAALGERGFLTRQGERWVLSREGLLRADSLLPEFYEAKYRNARYT